MPTPEQILANTVVDDGPFANFLDTKRFNQLWKVASGFARSTMVPEHYRGEPENCFIAVQMAIRLGVDPFMFMQKSYIVHGKPGMEAQLAIALVNSSNIFDDALDYEVDGDDPKKDDYRVRVFATRRSSGKVVHGPWIDWQLVRGEEWDKKKGSKWLTMPGLMFMYRAATFFARMHCPERLMGMNTVEELFDVGPVQNGQRDDSVSGGTSSRLAPASGRSGSPVSAARTARYEQDAAAAEASALLVRRAYAVQEERAAASDAAAAAATEATVPSEGIFADLLDRCQTTRSVAAVVTLQKEIAAHLAAKSITDEQACDLNAAIQDRLENL